MGVEALRQGNAQIVEYCYQKTKNFERLSFLYLIQGATDKLGKMLKIAEMRGDVMSRFHNALYLGDVRERVRVLRESGLTALAYACARSHGLEEEATALAEELGPEKLPKLHLPNGARPRLLMPPTPITRDQGNWPLVAVGRGFFDRPEGASAQLPEGLTGDELSGAMDGEEGGWGGDDLGLPGGSGLPRADDGEAGGDWDVDDLEIPPELVAQGQAAVAAADKAAAAAFAAPTPGVPAAQRWAQNSNIPGELAASGDFDSAMRCLNRQLGIVKFGPLRQQFLEVFAASHAFVPTACVGAGSNTSVPLHIDRDWSADNPTQQPTSPAVCTSVRALQARLATAAAMVTTGKFSEALRQLTSILHQCTLAVVDERVEVDSVREVIGTCREYITGLRLELRRKEMKDEDPGRQLELAAYFTHCNMQPKHVALALRSAMTLAFKLRAFATCAHFARRLVELNVDEKMVAQARQVLAACSAQPKDEISIQYDPKTPFDVCAITMTPIYHGSR